MLLGRSIDNGNAPHEASQVQLGEERVFRSGDQIMGSCPPTDMQMFGYRSKVPQFDPAYLQMYERGYVLYKLTSRVGMEHMYM